MTMRCGKTVYTHKFALTVPFVIACGLLAGSAWAQSQTKNATGFTENNPGNPGVDWIMPGNIVGAPDINCAATPDTPGGSWIQTSFTPYSIPGGESVSGIEARVKYHTSGSNEAQLTISGSLAGATRVIPLYFSGPSNCNSTTYVSAGGDGDLWGVSAATLKAAANAGTLGFRITQTNGPTLDIDSVELIVYYSPANTPPTADAGGPYSVPEGDSVSLTAAGSSDMEQSTASLSFAWDLDNDGMFDDATGIGPTFSAAGKDGPGSQTIKVRVTDAGGLSDTATATVNITNVAPTVGAVSESPDPSNEGVAVIASATYSDPGAPDTHTCTVDYGDGSGPLTGTATGGTCTGPPHIYVDDNPTGTPSDVYAVAVVVTDDDGGSNSNTGLHTVNNVAPTVGDVAVAPEPSDEGEAVAGSASYTDPGAADTHTCTVDYGDGTGPLAGTATGGTCTGPLHIYVDDNPTGTPSDSYTVTVVVTDDDTGSDSNTGAHTVRNVDPSIDAINLSAGSIDEGDPAGVTVTGSFSDPALGVATETFTGTALWSDGESTAVSVDSTAGTFETSRMFPDDHPMSGTLSDVFTVDITIADDDTGSDIDTSPELTVNNVDPTITATSNSAAECGDTPEGMPVDVTADFFDPGFGPTEDWAASTIDWGDGFSESATVAVTPGAPGTPTTGTISGSHVYASGGIFTVTLRVQDDDGGFAEDSVVALVTGAGLTPAGLLGVVGTDFLDVIGLRAKGSDIEVQAGFLGPGKASFPALEVVSMHVLACDANDQIHVDHKVGAPAILDGGPGPDHVRAGGGLSHLLGGEGDDHLFAGASGNVLEGGAGDDDLNGDTGNDILLGEDGDDKLAGDKGDDVLDGGPGIDDCNPGKGNDVVMNCEP